MTSGPRLALELGTLAGLWAARAAARAAWGTVYVGAVLSASGIGWAVGSQEARRCRRWLRCLSDDAPACRTWARSRLVVLERVPGGWNKISDVLLCELCALDMEPFTPTASRIRVEVDPGWRGNPADLASVQALMDL